jgi:hypothetical protein
VSLVQYCNVGELKLVIRQTAVRAHLKQKNGKNIRLYLGTNSIGWLIINDNIIENIGVAISPNLNDSNKRKLRRIEQRKSNYRNQDSQNVSTINKLETVSRKKTTVIVLSILTLLMFPFAFTFFENWQFWINLGIGSLIAIITFRNKQTNKQTNKEK